MERIRLALRELPLPLRHAVIGAAVLGIAGGLIGAVIGLRVHAPTAWAAAAELGLPAALVGAVLGLLVGSVVLAAHRARHG